MTDSKTIKPTGQAHFIYGLVCGASAPDGIGKDFAIGEIEKVILSYASDRLNFELRGYRQLTSLYEKKINELEAEVKRLKNSVPGSVKSYIAQVEHQRKELASLKSSLAEKEAELAHMTKLKEGFENHSWELAERNNADLAQLQLENGVMRSALERINEYCNDPSCGSVSKHALSTSTKSSLMEKVRNLVWASDEICAYEGEHCACGDDACDVTRVAWVNFRSALTEVKKEIGA